MRRSVVIQSLCPLGRWVTVLLVLMLAVGLSAQAMARDQARDHQRFHGAGIVKQCETSKVGDTTRCIIRVTSLDDFDDDIQVLEAWDEIQTADGLLREPEVGNLPIINVSGPTTCEVGGSLPCELLERGAFVDFLAAGYVIQEDDGVVGGDGIRRVLDQGRAIYLDLCNGEPSLDCNPTDAQQLSAGGSTPLFEPSISVNKTGPDLAKVGDEVCWDIGFDNTSSPNTPALQGCEGEDSFLGPLGAFVAGETREFCHTTSAADGASIFNEVTISCGLTGFDNVLSDSAEHTVELIDPSIAVTKTGPDAAKLGDEVTYTIGFVNTGTGALENCTGTDDVLGDLGAFEPGVNRDFAYTVTADDPNPLVNTATITCDVVGFDNQASDSDTHSLDWINPSISVTKAGPDSAKVGDEVTYTIGFANTGLGALENCTGTDTVLGDLGAFEPGVTRNFAYTVTADDPNPLVNTATITCDVVGFDNQASDSDTHSLDWIDPSIAVTKAGPDSAKVGDEVTYTIGFANTGVGALENCTGTDDVLGDLGAFEPGVNRNFAYTVTADDPNPLVNTASITCDVVGFDNQASDSDTHSLDWIDPSIAVTKTGPDSAKVGDEVIYTIGFANTGTGALENCTGTDDVLGDLGAFEPGESRNFAYTVEEDDPNPLVNTATITCDVVGFDNQASDSDTHSTELVDPGVELTKQCSPDPVLSGETIEWSLGLVNTGDVGLDCVLNDPEAGIVDELVRLEAGETSAPITASRTVLDEDFPVISNTASVLCSVDALDNTVEDEATADCEVEIPGEEICRTPGFWSTHAGTENRRSTNLTQMTIDAAGGELSICGQTINNTNVGNVNSALEAMCVVIQGQLERQLARQLTAMALNCVVSGGDADCSGTSVEELFADANAACIAGGGGPELGSWIDQVDCFNNGGQYIDGMCVIDPDDPNNCQNRELDEATDIFDGVSPFPGPAGSPRACSSARNNGIKVVPAL